MPQPRTRVPLCLWTDRIVFLNHRQSAYSGRFITMSITQKSPADRVVELDLGKPAAVAGKPSLHSHFEQDNSVLSSVDSFIHRHIGPDATDVRLMLDLLGYETLESLIDAAVPSAIQSKLPLEIPGIPTAGLSEREAIETLRAISKKNKVNKSFIGQGYYGTVTPPVILRNVLENPGWYTQYTPYQAEIAQGRLEALLNFQTMVADLTGLPLANASLLDEATAAAEAMAMCHAITGRNRFYVSDGCHPQTIAVVQTRADAIGVEVIVGDVSNAAGDNLAGVLVQYPATDGRIEDYSKVADVVHVAGGLVVCATDLLALTLIKPPGEWGADIAVGSTQRFGMPMGAGGPHAASISTKDEYARKLPGRIVGVSKDSHGNPALRLAIQTREQHIKRERATSNICTAQVLPAVVASMYAVYHGPNGLRRIAERVHLLAATLGEGLRRLGHDVPASTNYFDTVPVTLKNTDDKTVQRIALEHNVNLHPLPGREDFCIALDETNTPADVDRLLAIFNSGKAAKFTAEVLIASIGEQSIYNDSVARSSAYLTHPVFNTHHSETEMLRYITKLQSRDLSLAHSMIPLGSCTMKLNATAEMMPITWPEFADIHPFAPADQQQGYAEMFCQLESWLGTITGLPGVSLQPNAGSQGEFAGLLAIRAYHESRGDEQRNICLIPTSAHGTNPASAIVAGYEVVPVQCDSHGNVDLNDLRAQAEKYKNSLGALMITYPSTHGVFETSIKDICKLVHDHGGQVYLDGANMNAMVGLVKLSDIGADVCHLNLHKTFCIPHGGGGPGMGPICVAKHLQPFLPGHPFALNEKNAKPQAATGAISAAPYGSGAILPISWMYIAMMGGDGLTRATQTAILNANYMAKRLDEYFDVLFTGPNGLCAHEFIVDCRDFQKTSNVRIDDIAKRLIDYGFHAPTMSFPVPGTLMIEPTESEAKVELDRFCDAMIAIHNEIDDIAAGRSDKKDNVLRHAPHTIGAVTSDHWTHKYSREQAAFPIEWLRDSKFWPHVGRIDNPYGDRNLMCTCPPMSAFAE